MTRHINSSSAKLSPCAIYLPDNVKSADIRIVASPNESCLVRMPNNEGQVDINIKMDEPGVDDTLSCIVQMPNNQGKVSISIVSAPRGRPCTLHLPNNQGQVDIRIGKIRGQPCDIRLPDNEGQVTVSIAPSDHSEEDEPCVIHLPNNQGDVDIQSVGSIQKGWQIMLAIDILYYRRGTTAYHFLIDISDLSDNNDIQ